MSRQPAEERPLPGCPVGPVCLGGVSDTPEGLLDGSASGPGTQRALGPRQQLVVDLYGCTLCHTAILSASYVHTFRSRPYCVGSGSSSSPRTSDWPALPAWGLRGPPPRWRLGRSR